jgi:fucose 4-O-acetylase-like acetyltransferase
MLAYHTGSVDKADLRTYARKNFRSIMVPYFAFGALGVLFKTACAAMRHHTSFFVLSRFEQLSLDLIFLRGYNSIWFLPVLFIGLMVFFLMRHGPRWFRFAYLIAGVFAIQGAKALNRFFNDVFSDGSFLSEMLIRLVFAFGKGLMAAWFIQMGFYLFRYYRELKDNRVKIALGILLTVVNICISQFAIHVDIDMMIEGKYPALFYVGGIMGTMGMLMLVDVLSQRFELKGLCYLGVNSLTIMATHTVFGFRRIAYRGWSYVGWIPREAGLEYVLECFGVLAVLVLMEYGIVELVNRRFPFLNGYRSQKAAS